MRATFSVIYLILILALSVCSILAKRSDKPSKNAVAFLEAALIPPVLGNLVIVATSTRTVALIGCYMYYLGMDLVIGALVRFTDVYCRRENEKKHKPTIVYAALAADAIQMMLNPVFGHAFDVTAVDVDGYDYYKLIPYAGQNVHRIIDYIGFFCVILIFIIATARSPKISREKFAVILATMIAVGIVQTYNIFFQYAIDRSMIGYGVFGVVIFFFAIHYRPLRLLDRVLSNIVSGLSDAFYIFDPNGNCIWANEQGCRLAGTSNNEFDPISARLVKMFGEPDHSSIQKKKMKVGEGDSARFYLLEESLVKDDKGILDGSYLRIQDVTASEQLLKHREEQIGQISQEAYRDPLTGVGSNNAYNNKVLELDARIADGSASFAVVMVDINNLKYINDDFGHEAGDRYIRGCCHMICEAFKHSPVFRIGGDEFVVILQGHDFENREKICDELRNAYTEAFADTEKEPCCRYSAAVGIAEYPSDGETFADVFKRADETMYDEKRAFKKVHGSYR
ncbi:MAG: diguanylate cyclase [Ruminococcus sp.]|nr:diguanylate cyclase [Ruminococcus sp.]